MTELKKIIETAKWDCEKTTESEEICSNKKINSLIKKFPSKFSYKNKKLIIKGKFLIESQVNSILRIFEEKSLKEHSKQSDFNIDSFKQKINRETRQKLISKIVNCDDCNLFCSNCEKSIANKEKAIDFLSKKYFACAKKIAKNYLIKNDELLSIVHLAVYYSAYFFDFDKKNNFNTLCYFWLNALIKEHFDFLKTGKRKNSIKFRICNEKITKESLKIKDNEVNDFFDHLCTLIPKYPKKKNPEINDVIKVYEILLKKYSLYDNNKELFDSLIKNNSSFDIKAMIENKKSTPSLRRRLNQSLLELFDHRIPRKDLNSQINFENELYEDFDFENSLTDSQKKSVSGDILRDIYALDNLNDHERFIIESQFFYLTCDSHHLYHYKLSELFDKVKIICKNANRDQFHRFMDNEITHESISNFLDLHKDEVKKHEDNAFKKIKECVLV